MFAKTLETIQSSGRKQATYTRWILAILAVCVALKALWFSRLGIWDGRNLVDFDAFHIIAERVWLGDVDQAYQFAKLIDMQREASGGVTSFMPWTYPPQFSLLLAPLALVPTGVAYFLFIASTLAFYLLVLRSIAGSNFVLLLIILFPAMAVTMACGQNGFLMAGLFGLVCLLLEERPILAGLALGLMIIKPHLAVAIGIYCILRRCWIAVMTAGAVVLISSVICTAVFGVQIWTGLLQSVRDSSTFLEQGYYPLYRMISFYAALRTAGLSASAAFLGQGLVAALALGIVAVAVYRRMPTHVGLGLTAMVSACVSPYAYDYDFLIFGIGLALLLPELVKAAREGERGIIYAAPMLIGAYGTLQSSRLGTDYSEIQYLDLISIGGFAVVSLIGLVFMILLRRSKTDPAQSLLSRDDFKIVARRQS
jgi:hypothetical protein